jgi:thiol:disulfide interchange protein DsbD
MKYSKLVFLLALFIFTCATAMAQTSASVVKVRPEQSTNKIKSGTSAQISLVLDIDNGYHINSNRPTEKYLIPTTLKLDRLSGLTVAVVRYPKAKLQKFSFSDKPLSVFEGKAVLKFTARALPSLAPGNHTLKGKLTLQACNDQLCLRPQTVDVDIPIEVSK